MPEAVSVNDLHRHAPRHMCISWNIGKQEYGMVEGLYLLTIMVRASKGTAILVQGFYGGAGWSCGGFESVLAGGTISHPGLR